MTFRPEAFLESAAALLKQSDSSEAHCRTVVGRCYYAVYGALRARLCGGKRLSADILFARRGRHSELVRLLALSGGRFKPIHLPYQKLYRGRVQSDYRYSDSVAIADAREAYEEAQWAVGRLASLDDRDFRGFPLEPPS